MDFLLHHMLCTTAHRFPDKEALVHAHERLKYADVLRSVSGLAQALREIGIKRGERVGIFLEHSVAQVIAIFGISYAGAVYVPINCLLFPNQLAHIAASCGMRVLITANSKLGSLLLVLPKIPTLEFVVTLSDSEAPSTPLRRFDFDEMTRNAVPRTWVDWGISRDLAAILYTSGSTGKPKGVMLSHANIMAGASIVSAYLEITDDDRILAVLPFSFDAGLNQLTTAFQKGSCLVLMNFVFAQEILQTLSEERITGLAGVPTLWTLLTQPNSGLLKQSFPDLRYITNTGGAMPQSVLSILRRALPSSKIYLMYGLTEAFRSTYLRPEELERRPTSIGKAIPDTEILVLRDDGTRCLPGEVGELVHRGPTVFMGYWNDPELTEKTLQANRVAPAEVGREEKVCYSGDLVMADDEGFFYYVGRRDTMIKSSGFRISPTEVEEILFQSGVVRDAAVVGVPDGMLGQAIKAFVVPQEGRVDPDELLAFCAERLPKYMVPKFIEVIPDLPKTSSGKVDYSELQRREGYESGL